MSKVFFVLAILLFATQVQASPFLVCDPYPATGEQPTEFRITYGANTITSSAQTMPDGSKRLYWDLGPLSSGLYNINVTAVKVDPIWGNQESTPVPFSFTKPAMGAIPLPANLKLLR